MLRLLSRGIRRQAEQRGVSYRFVFMRAEGKQLEGITSLIESGVITPVVDRVFALAQTAEALACVDSGRVKGKVVVTVA